MQPKLSKTNSSAKAKLNNEWLINKSWATCSLLLHAADNCQPIHIQLHTRAYFINHLTNGRHGCTCCRAMRCDACSDEERRNAAALRRFRNGNPSVNRRRNVDRNSNGGRRSRWRMRSGVLDRVTSVELVHTEMCGLVAALCDRIISSNPVPFTTTVISDPPCLVEVL